MLDRVLRFRRALDLGRSTAASSLGMLAFAAGYADQAHFSRECRRLAGQTPSELFKTAR
jgi:AraC-like DNA-binding protein